MRSTTLTAEGRMLRRWLVGAAIAIILFNLVNLALRALRPTEEVFAPPGSSYGTNADATLAWDELLDALGFRTTRLEQPLSTVQLGSGRLGTDDTLVIMEPGFWQPEPADIDRLQEFLEGGGRLVLGGQMPDELIDGLFEVPPTYDFDGPTTSTVLVGSEVTEEVRSITGPGFGVFDDPGSGIGLMGNASQVLLLAQSLGQGNIFYVADAAVFSNRFIGESDNALLAVNLAGGRRVVFDEYVHGFGGEGFWQNVPGRWQVMIWLLGLALLVWMVAVGRRFGPPERVRRDLAPERRTYVDSLGGLMARAKQPEAARAIVQRATWRELMGRSVVDPSREALIEAAVSRGLEPNDVDLIIAEERHEARRRSEEDLIATDRILARISGGQK